MYRALKLLNKHGFHDPLGQLECEAAAPACATVPDCPRD